MTTPNFDDQARARLAALPVLEDVEEMGHAVIFVGREPDGSHVRVKVPRPLWLTYGFYLLPDTVSPAVLTVWQGTREVPQGYFCFAVFDEDPAGAALRKKLEGLART